MKTKILIMLIGFIGAIGMSFTNGNIKTQSMDYVRDGSNWITISEQSCDGNGYNCRVQFGEGGPVYNVYDEKKLSTLKDSGTPIPTIINP